MAAAATRDDLRLPHENGRGYRRLAELAVLHYRLRWAGVVLGRAFGAQGDVSLRQRGEQKGESTPPHGQGGHRGGGVGAQKGRDSVGAPRPTGPQKARRLWRPELHVFGAVWHPLRRQVLRRDGGGRARHGGARARTHGRGGRCLCGDCGRQVRAPVALGRCRGDEALSVFQGHLPYGCGLVVSRVEGGGCCSNVLFALQQRAPHCRMLVAHTRGCALPGKGGRCGGCVGPGRPHARTEHNVQRGKCGRHLAQHVCAAVGAAACSGGRPGHVAPDGDPAQPAPRACHRESGHGGLLRS
mmetsp:Transcript_3748/g.9466  ORF Transcript_3748/g.9466 Transcript_3748/m.9466 type:complete len:298 (+) Transcript_3748:1502-2395(+)